MLETQLCPINRGHEDREYPTLCNRPSLQAVQKKMPHRTRPLTALLLFTGLNAVLVSTITPVYDFVCFLPYWERRRERRRLERERSSLPNRS